MSCTKLVQRRMRRTKSPFSVEHADFLLISPFVSIGKCIFLLISPFVSVGKCIFLLKSPKHAVAPASQRALRDAKFVAVRALLPLNREENAPFRLVPSECADGLKEQTMISLCGGKRDGQRASGGLRDQSLKNPLLLPPNKQSWAIIENESPPDAYRL